MPRGGYRPGAGRPKGAKTGERREIQATAHRLGLTPLEYMLAVMRDETQDTDRRLRMACAAAPFVHPKAGDMPASDRSNDDDD